MTTLSVVECWNGVTQHACNRESVLMIRRHACHARIAFFISLVVAYAALFSCPAEGAEESGSAAEDSLSEPEEPTRADVAHHYVSDKVRHSAQWFDAFFDDPNYVEEDASTRLRVRTDAFFSKKDDVQFSANINLKLHLPKLSHTFKNKTSLLLGGDETLEDPDSGVSGSIDDAFNDAVDDPTIGLQYFLLMKKKLNINLTAGVKLSGPAVFIGPRASYVRTLTDKLLMRFIQRIRWYTDEGWDSRTRIDLDRAFGQNYLFRQTLDVRWDEESSDEDGFRIQLRSSVTQRLANRRAIAYRWNTLFKTEPSTRAESTVFLLQYRQRIYRKWLFYELIPQVAFQNEYDWKANPGITFRLEVVFGS